MASILSDPVVIMTYYDMAGITEWYHRFHTSDMISTGRVCNKCGAYQSAVRRAWHST